jgi:hypothetical protein
MIGRLLCRLDAVVGLWLAERTLRKIEHELGVCRERGDSIGVAEEWRARERVAALADVARANLDREAS